MKIIIAGGSGFIGQHLSKYLINSDYEVIILSRNPQRVQSLFKNKIRCLHWNDFDTSSWQGELESTAVIINLIGENIAQWPWTDQIKHKILYSRIHAGQTIIEAINKAKKKPRLLIQSSATGYYGNNNIDTLIEETPAGSGFLADVCQQWEQSTLDVESMGVKRCVIRIGHVLGKNGGLLKKMVLPFKFFSGGPIGSGKQILPWIHMDDLVTAIRFLIESDDANNINNLCAPNPVNMKTFAKLLGKMLRRPSILKIPEFAVKLILGEMGRETILSGQNAIPKTLLDSGYQFNFIDLDDALNNLLSK
jgi:uncharacterized protein (TIGR01777 family)